MDDSFMSICNENFDEESFICQALDDSSYKLEQVKSANKSMSIDVSSLLTEPRLSDISNTKSDVTEHETPRNSGCIARERKRKNLARRCLSTDLNNDFSFSSEDDRMTFQDFRHSKEIKRTHDSFVSLKNSSVLSSIENTISPKSNFKSFENSCIDLTPEFNQNKKNKQNENEIKVRVPMKYSNNQSGGVMLQKCFSENHASIMRAVQISSSDPTLIGDFSKAYVLPLLKHSKHQDLKSISCHVLADLLNGKYNNEIESFTIVDCRYPYEYAGGHIQTALNLYTQDNILSRFIKNKTKDAESDHSNSKREIIIFHCEFSSERGPNLCRFLRNKDRVKNSRVYPNLHYPELYLLEGGYKEFFNNYSHLCEPQAYLPMHSKNHEEDLRKFRSICKSFDSKFSTHKRNLRL